jgi:transcriptional regulator with XRE-family HTH domain
MESGPESQRLGRMVLSFRVLRNWSQERLAAAMSELGHSWSQNTVFRIENGQRDIRWDEAVGLAALLEFNLGDAVVDLQRYGARLLELVKLIEEKQGDIKDLIAEGDDISAAIHRWGDPLTSHERAVYQDVLKRARRHGIGKGQR